MSDPNTRSPDQSEISDADRRAAHDFLCELRTRIATQPLPYQHGNEARALESLWELFGLARMAMKDHVGCAHFARITTTMLNVDLRPVTAKWHRAYQAGVLEARDGANAFREDLAKLRQRLATFAEELQGLAYGYSLPDRLTPPVVSDTELAACMSPVRFGIDETGDDWKAINSSEVREISARRKLQGVATELGVDATGLSLSGGGIRSATFCLGVLQVFSEIGLMKDIDYLSTVSGGGFVGGFMSSLLGSGLSLDEIAPTAGQDTAPVPHLRQNAKYLSPVNLKQRWMMIAVTLSGLILNWTAPLAALAFLALIASHFAMAAQFWVSASIACVVAMLVAIIIHGFTLRLLAETWTKGLVATFGLAAVSCGAMALLEWGYRQFHSPYALIIFATTSLAAIITPVLVRFLAVTSNERHRRLLFEFSLYAAGLLVPLTAILIFYLLRDLGRSEWSPTSPWWDPLHYMDGNASLLAILGVSTVIATIVLNINRTGPHKLYRDQLARTFIWPASEPDRELAKIDTQSRGPYHLINATVNLPSSVSPVLRDREANFFLFSQHL